MLVCTFFGHRDCPDSIEPVLREAIVDLITDKGVSRFLVGAKGNFDRLVRRILWELESYYDFDYYVMQAYLPTVKNRIALFPEEENKIMLPVGFEKVPPRYAIDYCNNYMLRDADFVITYVTRSFGGAAKFAQKAIRQKKTVMNLAEMV